MTSYNDDVTRNTFNLMVWAQFELQAGIICASAPALRVFFRRYLGGGGGGGGNDLSRRSRTNASGIITVVRDTSVTFDKDGSVMPASEKKQFHELRDVETPEEEYGEDCRSASRFSNCAGEPLTRYSHDEDSVGLSHVSQFPWSAGPAGRST